MKKLKFISALALTLILGACDNFDLPNPPGQTNPEPDAYFQDADLDMNTVNGTLELAEANQQNVYVTVADITKLENFPAGYDLVIDMQLANDAQFSKSTTVTTTIDGDKLTVNPDVLNGAVQEILTKKPGTYDVNARFLAYAVRGTTRLRLGGIDKTYGDGILKIHTLDAAKVIEDAYYLVKVNAQGQPDMGSVIAMNNTSGAGVSGYDNPEFAIKLDVPEGVDYYWMIAPQSVITAHSTDGLFGGNPEEGGMAGKLGVGYGAIKMPVAGAVLVTVNMEQDSYTVSYAFDVLYPFPAAGGNAANLLLLYTNDYINYSGVTVINRVTVIYTTADKSGVKFTADPEVPQEVSADGYTISGGLTSGDGDRLDLGIKGNALYYANVNLVQETYNFYHIETLSIVGAHNSWNEKEAPELTPSKDFKTWTINDIHLDGDFKLNCNHAWDYDFGGEQLQDVAGQHVYNVWNKGGNLTVGEGTYDVTVNFSTLPYVVTLTKKN